MFTALKTLCIAQGSGIVAATEGERWLPSAVSWQWVGSVCRSLWRGREGTEDTTWEQMSVVFYKRHPGITKHPITVVWGCLSACTPPWVLRLSPRAGWEAGTTMSRWWSLLHTSPPSREGGMWILQKGFRLDCTKVGPSPLHKYLQYWCRPGW